MPLLPLNRLIFLGLILSLSAGCSQNKLSFNRGGNEAETYYTRSDIDELLGFGADMAGRQPNSRSEICRALLKHQKETQSPSIQLHLMMGRLFSDSCGDISRVVDGVESIPAKSLPDDRVRWLVAIETETLKRMNSLSRRVGSLERKQKSVQNVLESKDAKESKESKDVKSSKKDDARLLREKLEAIRAMEKKLDESGDGNQ